MDQKEVVREISQISKSIKWLIPDNIKTEHATHLVIQQQGSEFILMFFEILPPLFTGTSEEQLKQFQELPFTEAKCLSRIVMSAENIALATNNLVEVLNNFNTLLHASAKGQDNAKATGATDLPGTKRDLS